MIKRNIEEAAKELQSEIDKLILEEKEMGVMFDQYIKNVDTIDIEMLPDCHQVKLQVRTGEDIHLFLLEGKGVKILADRYMELKAENCRLKKERDKLLEKTEQLDKKRGELAVKVGDLQIEKARLEQEKKDISEHDRKLNHDLEVKSCEQSRLQKENHELALKMRNQSKEIDKLEKRNKYLNKQIDEIVRGAYHKIHVRIHDEEITMDELVNRFLELEKLKTPTIENFVDEEPHSRSDILRCAEKCVCGKREQDYGTPESNFQIIADLWNGYLGTKHRYPDDDNPINVAPLRPLDVSMMMALLKIARIRNGGGTGDSFVDLAWYAACGGEINAQKKATKTN